MTQIQPPSCSMFKLQLQQSFTRDKRLTVRYKPWIIKSNNERNRQADTNRFPNVRFPPSFSIYHLHVFQTHAPLYVLYVSCVALAPPAGRESNRVKRVYNLVRGRRGNCLPLQEMRENNENTMRVNRTDRNQVSFFPFDYFC